MKNQFYKNNELLKEIVFNLKAHKLRTILTSFGIAWGIFILVVLLGISGGVKEGVFELFKGFSSKTIWFYGGTSIDNIAMRDTGEEVKFNIQELDKLKHIFPEVTSVSSEIQESYVSVQYDGNQDFFNIVYTSDQTFSLKNLKTEKGRAINLQDIKEHRYVAVIVTDSVAHVLCLEEKHLVYENDSCYAWIKSPNNQFNKTNLTTGLSDGFKTQIKSELTLDSRVKLPEND